MEQGPLCVWALRPCVWALRPCVWALRPSDPPLTVLSADEVNLSIMHLRGVFGMCHHAGLTGGALVRSYSRLLAAQTTSVDFTKWLHFIQ